MKKPYIKIEDEFVIIHDYAPDNQWAVYDIPLKELKTKKGLEEWIAHLQEKNWFTEALEKELRKLAKTWQEEE